MRTLEYTTSELWVEQCRRPIHEKIGWSASTSAQSGLLDDDDDDDDLFVLRQIYTKRAKKVDNEIQY